MVSELEYPGELVFLFCSRFKKQTNKLFFMCVLEKQVKEMLEHVTGWTAWEGDSEKGFACEIY